MAINPLTEGEISTADRAAEPSLPSNMTLFMRSVRADKRPLLTAREEVELGRRIHRGDSAARDELIERNFRLVVNLAARYARLFSQDIEELKQSGMVGLIEATDRFDPEKGYRFSTYATPWIRKEIREYLEDNSRTIRVPSEVHNKIVRLRYTRRQLLQQLGREPTEEELLKKLGWKPAKLHHIVQVELMTSYLTSLQTRIGEEDERAELQDLIADSEEPVSELVIQKIWEEGCRESADELLPELTERNGEIIKARFGFDGTEPAKLEEIGRTFGITRERVRQIETRTLKTFEQHPAARRLRPA